MDWSRRLVYRNFDFYYRFFFLRDFEFYDGFNVTDVAASFLENFKI